MTENTFVQGSDWSKVTRYTKTGRTGACDTCRYHNMTKRIWCRHPTHDKVRKLLSLMPWENLPYCNRIRKFLHELCSPDSNFDFIRDNYWVGCDYYEPADRQLRT